MSSSDKGFEEKLIEAGNKLLDPPAAVDDLLPLLDNVEYHLSRVKQSPNKLIEDALSPCTKALVADKIFRHPDTDVMVAVASCISEITRITAPEAPYTDEQMKEAFQLIVSSFKELADNSSRSYAKRTSILETVAKVRSCVVMLDLECDGLILEMFKHFFKGIRDYHPEHVFSSMETIMGLVIEESEDISAELLSPILETLKKDNEGVLPIAAKLGEKVLQNCSTKLKDYLGQALVSLGSSVDDYSEVVRIICQDGIAENRKPDTTPAAIEVENEAASPKSEVSNGGKQAAEEGSLADRVSMKQPEIVPQKTRLKITGLLSKDKPDKSESEKEAKIATKSKKTGRRRGRKWSTVRRSIKPTDSTNTDGKEEPGQPLDNGGDPSSNLPRSPREDQLGQADLPLDDGKETEVAPPNETAIESVNVSSPPKSEEPNKKEGSLKEPEGLSGSEAKEDASHGKKSGGGASNEDRTPIKVKISRKGSEAPGNAEGNSVKPSTDKVIANTADQDGSSRKSLKSKDKKGPAKGGKVHQKDMAVPSEKDVDEEKPIPLSKSTKKSQRDEHQVVETPKSKGKRKHQEDEDRLVETSKEKGKRTRTPAKQSNAKEYGEELVGSKVKVWWPKDKAFYEGVVDSFDAVKKRHKILYTDGDVETLNLKTQRWEIMGNEAHPNEKQDVAEKTRESSPEMTLKKLLELSSGKKLSALKGKKGIFSKKSKVASPTTDQKPHTDGKLDANLETDSTGKSKEKNTPNIGSKLVGLARRMTKSKGGSESKEEGDEVQREKLKKDPETAAKGRTPKSVGRPKKVKSGGSSEVKSSSLKMKPKESMEVNRDSEEPSEKVKPKSKKTKEVDRASGEDPSDKAKSSSSKLKSKEGKKVRSDSGEEPSSKLKSGSLEAKQKSKLRGRTKVDKDSGEEPSDKVESKPKLNDSEDVDMGSGEEPSDKVKSEPLKQKPSPDLKESEQEKEKASPKVSEQKDNDSGEEVPSDKVNPKSPKPKETEEDTDLGEETEEDIAFKKEKPLAESSKTPTTGRRTGKKRRRGA